MDGVDSIREVLSRNTIYLDSMNDDNCIFGQVDAFVALSRDNETVQNVLLFTATDLDDDDDDDDRYAIGDKIAEGIGNFQALRQITIIDFLIDEEEAFVRDRDWEILACILRRLRHGIRLCIDFDDVLLWNTEALPVFAGVIRGQAMITGFRPGNKFPFQYLNILCSVLLTLPALENVSFEHIDGEGPEEGQSLENMVKLLQSPSLREVTFQSVAFTHTLLQAVAAKVLEERSKITDLRFYHCSFPEGGDAVIAGLLKTNTTLKCLNFMQPATDEVFYKVLAATLLSNSTLQKLSLITHSDADICSWLSPLFLALQVNHGLKELKIGGFDLIDEELSTAMRLGLGKNSTLELLQISCIELGDNDTCLWREALSFLRINTALKTLFMHFDDDVKESRAATIRLELLAMLHENESLETLSMPCWDARFQDYIEFVAAIQPNTTLKILRLYPFNGVNFSMDEDETKELLMVLKKNYGLEEITGLQHGAGDVNSIFQLNRAGRRYLVQDGSSISKGVDVLSRVNDDTNSVFLHLLENPRLCV
jgi:hypothetical protein